MSATKTATAGAAGRAAGRVAREIHVRVAGGRVRQRITAGFLDSGRPGGDESGGMVISLECLRKRWGARVSVVDGQNFMEKREGKKCERQ